MNRTLFLSDNQSNSIGYSQEEQNPLETPVKAAAHAPIIINGSAELDAFPDKSGSGNPSDPYIIQNLEISTEGTFGSTHGCLILYNISSYLVCRNIIIENLLISANPLRFIYLSSCNNVDLDIITIRNSDCSNTGNSFVLYLEGCANLTLSNVHITNVSIYKGVRFVLASCGDILIESFEDLNGKFQSYTTEIYFSGTHDVIIQNGKISPSAMIIPEFDLFFLIFSNNIHLINLKFEHTSINGGLLLFYYVGLIDQNFTVDNLIIQDIQANWISSAFLDANVIIRNCQFIDLFSAGKINIIDAYNSLMRIESNLMQNLSTHNANITAIQFDSTCDNAIIFDNEFRMFDAGTETSSCLKIPAGSNGHQIYYNRFMTGTQLVVDDAGGNQYTGLIYFPPVHMDMYVGNYWIDHHLDESSDLHYFVTSPKTILGTGNSIDPLPLHYFGMDFDHDTVLNFYEDQHGYDIWDPDTDHDGILDSNESTSSTGWTVSLFNDPPTVFLGAIILLLFLNLIIRPKQAKDKLK